ncbi:uncharacterized protein LOC143283824 [Babylonia areolata]|uniref:uncharacterized protein LOC143283824 n=1 Tax=Babylonia areolata TaxID=304850 RepID=UPI003FD24D85
MVESCTPKELVATSSFQALVYNGSTEPQCAWVIRGADEGDVIGMRVTDWITPSGFSCSRDRLIIRDGSHTSSPYLRVLCGAMCGVLNDDTEVMTSTNYMRVVYMPFDLKSLQQRGFTLIYRSLSIQIAELSS